MDTTIENFRLSAHPLGNEVDIRWDYKNAVGENRLNNNYQFYIFKRSEKEIDDNEILDYVANPVFEALAKGLFVFLNISQFEREIKDFKVEENKKYYYKAIIVDKNDKTNYSDIVSSNIENVGFQGKINVVDAKGLVIEGLRKIMSSVGKFVNADIMVYNDFPMEADHNAFIVVTRANGEVAYRFWSNLITDSATSIVTGEIEKDIIQVVWECVNSPGLRDKITNIMRGTTRLLQRYIQNQTGAKSVHIIHTGDGVDGRYTNGNLMYGSMLIEVLIENNLTAPKGVDAFSEVENLFINNNG